MLPTLRLRFLLCLLSTLAAVNCQAPLSCGLPDSLQNTTVVGTNFTVGNQIQYKCPKGQSLIGDTHRLCQPDGTWSGRAPTCKYVDCGPLPELEHGATLLSEQRISYAIQATYGCHENYTLFGNKNRTCELNGWTGKQPECLVNWCPEPPRIVAGSFTVSDKRAGSTVTYVCEAGYVLIGEPIISCDLGGKWSSKPPSCRFVDCGVPARPVHGVAVLSNLRTSLGSVVKYECEDGYWLDGPFELYCTKDGKWSGDVPVCKLVICDKPHIPAGAYIEGNDYKVHSKITYQCNRGLVLRGNPISECLESGEWNNDSPSCEYIDCGPITPIPYGVHEYTQNTTYVDSEVTFSCLQSRKLNGVTKRTCLLTGVWSDTSPECEEMRCTEPALTPHSLVSVTDNDRMYGATLAESNPYSAQTYVIGAHAKYRCERGYKMVGKALVTCEDNGQWSGVVPECVYVECGVPSNITMGKVTLATNATYYGAAALFECNTNFKLDGVSRRLCTEDGTWSNESPNCVEITCDEPDISENLIVEANERAVGGVAKFKCQKGTNMLGNDTRVCLKSGKWTGKSPTCKPVDCGRPLPIENGRVVVVNDSTLYGGSVEYHCIPNFNRVGQYLQKCTEDGTWSGNEPRCEVAATEAQASSVLGAGIGIGAGVIIALLIATGLIVMYRNRARPVRNTENIQGTVIFSSNQEV